VLLVGYDVMGTTRMLLVLLSKGRIGHRSRGIMFFGNCKHDNEGSRHGTTCPMEQHAPTGPTLGGLQDDYLL